MISLCVSTGASDLPVDAPAVITRFIRVRDSDLSAGQPSVITL
jgi:hypothetical protein